jgi:hypothetical protein
VELPAPPSPQAFRRGRRCAFTHPARLLVVAHRLDHQRAEFSDRLFAGARPGKISRTRFPEPLRFAGAAPACRGTFHPGTFSAFVLPVAGRDFLAIAGLGIFHQHHGLFHATSSINSLAHLLGRRRYETEDNSRNSLILALITLGEGWHNNHHRYMNATRQGFYWWEIDISYYLLKAPVLDGPDLESQTRAPGCL